VRATGDRIGRPREPVVLAPLSLSVILFLPGSLKHHVSDDYDMTGDRVERRLSALRRLYAIKLRAQTMPTETMLDQLWMYRRAIGFSGTKKATQKAVASSIE
jgi:hypothetical protein